jgi:hypothetical protein
MAPDEFADVNRLPQARRLDGRKRQRRAVDIVIDGVGRRRTAI